jgi:hypothetical protein
VAVFSATALGAAYWAFEPAQLFLARLTPAVLVFPLEFLMFSRAAGIIMPVHLPGSAAGTFQKIDNDVVALVLDELPLVTLLTPELELNRERFPNFARLAENAHWFPGARTGSEETGVAVTSALTGLNPGLVQGKLPTHVNFPGNLFSTFRYSHRMSVHEESTSLCPPGACAGRLNIQQQSASAAGLADDLVLAWLSGITPAPWSKRLPPLAVDRPEYISGEEASLPALADAPKLARALAVAQHARPADPEGRTEKFTSFINGISNSESPQVLYLHTLLPRAPWNRTPGGTKYAFGEDGEAFGLWTDESGTRRWIWDPLAATLGRQRQLLQAQYLDRQLGHLLDRLREENMYEESALVVFAGHGTSFLTGQPWQMFNIETLTDLSAVPLFIKMPGQSRGYRHEQIARLQDILPTILDGLGVSGHASTSGASLLGENGGGSGKDSGAVSTRGQTSSHSYEEHMAQLAVRASELETLFGAGEEDDLYRVGSYPELHGLPLSALRQTAPSHAHVRFKGEALFRNVDPDGAFVPRLVLGDVEPGLDISTGQAVAIVVNGILQATTRLNAIPGYRLAFAALLPPAALQAGDNQLAVYAINDPGGRTRLSELPGDAGHGWSYAGDSFIRRSDGKEFHIENADFGHVETAAIDGLPMASLSGRIDPAQGDATTILAFLDGQLAASGFSDSDSGIFAIPVPAGAGSEARDLRVFQIDATATTAAELPYPPPCSKEWHFAPPANWAEVECLRSDVSPLARDGGEWRGEIDPGDPASGAYLGRGWGVAESGSRWTVGKEAVLRIPLPALLRELSFETSVRPFLDGNVLEHQEIWLLANGQAIATWTLREPDFTRINWKVPPEVLAIDPGQLELRFLTPDADSQSALNTGADERELGIAFISISVQGTAADPE